MSNTETTTPSKSRKVKTSTIVKSAVAVLALVGLWMWWQWADKFASSVITFAHRSFYVLGPLVVFVVLVLAIIVACAWGFRARNSGHGLRRDWEKESDKDFAARVKAAEEKKASRRKVAGFVVGGLVVVTLGFTGLTIKFWVTHSYNVDRNYVTAIQVVDGTVPEANERVAQPVAKALSPNNLGDITGDLKSVRYIAQDNTWNALAERRTRWYQGSYEAIQEQHLTPTGVSESTVFCEFDQDNADRRVGGMFGSSLERAIYHEARGTTFDEDDVFGVCDGENHDHPLVIVPLKKVEGWLFAHEVPAGVAVYDGLTGEVEILDSVEAGRFDGPVYPMSLAERTREATVSMGTWSERKRAGYDLGSSENNNSEFSLELVDGGAAYVTPLTTRGSSEAIVAQGFVSSDNVTAGKLNTLTVYKLPESRTSNKTMENAVHSDYADLEWASGLNLYEITPVSTDEWVASLGMEQRVKYRVWIKADGTSCLETATGTKLRCSDDAPGNSTGTETDGGTSVEVPSDNTAMRELTDAELVELQAEVTREVLRRVGAGELSSEK